MKTSIQLKNKYISANNNEEPDRLKFYDSDGEYIDYIPLDGPANYDEIAEFLGLLFFGTKGELSAETMAGALCMYFDSCDGVISNANFDFLYDVNGREYVNRIGTAALLLQE